LALVLIRIECAADDPKPRVGKDQERYTISIALEFSKKNRSSLVRALSSLVAVTPNAYATGFVVADGLVMTSYHVVSGQLSPDKMKRLGFKPGDTLEVTAYVNGCVAKTVRVDTTADLALLRVCTQSKQAKRATFAATPESGDQLLVIAHPGDYRMVRRGSFRGPYVFRGYEYWSVRVDGQDGFSGSPVYDSKGDIVGVFCRYDWKQGIGLLSPATQAQKLLADYDANPSQP